MEINTQNGSKKLEKSNNFLIFLPKSQIFELNVSIISLINLLINFKTRPSRDYQVDCGLKVLPSPIKINHRNSPKLQSLAQGLIIGNWCQSSTERRGWLELCQWELGVLTTGGGTGSCQPACNQTKISQITNNWFIILLRSYNDVKLSGFQQDVFFFEFSTRNEFKILILNVEFVSSCEAIDSINWSSSRSSITV